MKISEAIRLGAMMRPQGFGAFYVDPIWKTNGPLGLSLHLQRASCALGAASDAIDGEIVSTQDGAVFNYPDAWDSFMYASGICPECHSAFDEDGDGMDQFDVISHLNDYHRWTRERIADWVEIVEVELAEKEQPAQVEA